MVVVDLQAKKVVKVISTPRKSLPPDMPKWPRSKGRRNQEMDRMKGALFACLAFLLMAVPLLGACTKEVAEKRSVETEVAMVETPELVIEGPPRKFIEVSASTDKGTHVPGTEIEIELSFENVSGETLQIAPFPPETRILRPRTHEIVEDSGLDARPGPTPTPLAQQDLVVRIFPAGTGSSSLGPGEVASFVVTWDQRDSHGQPAESGHYKLLVGEFCAGDCCMTRDLSESVQLLILPPEGVMEKSVEVNESQTANGITITLERIELAALSTSIYALNVPPDYSFPQNPVVPGSDLPQGTEPAPPSMIGLHAQAEYSLDGGPTRNAGQSGISFREDGMRLSWIMLDPIPQGTKELTFIITRLGDQEGPWEFQVSLE